MSFEGWVALLGLLLLAMALSSAWVRRFPISPAAIYLGIGCLIGPWGWHLVRVDVTAHAHLFERLTETAVVLSLFVGGLRLRLPLTHAAWRAAFRLASLVMVLCIAGLALVLWQVFHFDPAIAVLIAAILAPTDPVLAGEVTIGHAQDHDKLRYALSGEAGLNDGAAFPFVVLGLLLLHQPVPGAAWAHWLARDVIWATGSALIVGFLLGRLVGRAAILLRARQRDTAAPTDFLALALIALAYVIAQAIGGWSFLAVFAAGFGLRRAEIHTVAEDPHPDTPTTNEPHPPAETLVAPTQVTEEQIEQPAVAAGVLVSEVFSFGDTVERILEVLLVVTVGASLATHFSVAGVLIGAILIFGIRPLMCALGLIGTSTTPIQRVLISWFGIRGIGSLYYVAYAATHGLDRSNASLIADICLSAVALSILMHGMSSQHLMTLYERQRAS